MHKGAAGPRLPSKLNCQAHSQVWMNSVSRLALIHFTKLLFSSLRTFLKVLITALSLSYFTVLAKSHEQWGALIPEKYAPLT